jgi:hypothetical protein
LEKVVVEARVLVLAVVAVVALVAGTVSVAVATAFAATVVSLAGTPAAESTHSFMLVIDMRVTLSERAFAAATVAGLAESTAALVGFGTKVVNWACNPAGARSAVERASAVIV